LRVEIEKRARADIRAIRSYIAKDNPQAAMKTVRIIRAQIGTLSDQPDRGRTGRIEGTRELVVTGLPYIVCYVLSDDAVTILRVLHGRQNWPETV
jgi:toxin ParE1/3/4